jgi:hypothetical protein
MWKTYYRIRKSPADKREDFLIQTMSPGERFLSSVDHFVRRFRQMKVACESGSSGDAVDSVIVNG